MVIICDVLNCEFNKYQTCKRIFEFIQISQDGICINKKLKINGRPKKKIFKNTETNRY